MRRSILLVIVAVALAGAALSALGYQLFFAPVTLRVAAGPSTSEEARTVAALALAVNRERSNVRLRLVPGDNPRANSDLLQAGKVDLAVIRPDVAMPTNGATVAIMRRNLALFIATEKSGIRTIAGLRGRSVGVVPGRQANRALLDATLRLYGISAEQVKVVEIDRQDLAAAAREGQVDVFFAVAPLVEGLANDIVPIIEAESDGPATLLPIQEAPALAQRNPALEATEIPRGTFGGAPARPAAPVVTLAATHRLYADRALDEATVAQLTRLLFQVRPIAARDVPAVNRIETPDTEDKGAALPVHPGTIAYFEGEERPFIERYGEWIYIAIMIVGFAGSGLAALFSRGANEARVGRGSLDVAGLMGLLRAARNAADMAETDRIEAETDAIMAKTLERASVRGVSGAMIAGTSLAIGEVRQAIAERRRALEHAGAPQGDGRGKETVKEPLPEDASSSIAAQ